MIHAACLPTALHVATLMAAEKPDPADDDVAVEPEAGGLHVRIVTPEGPVHLFRPPGYDRGTAGIVVYVHGYYATVDEAWRDHKLALQFAASGRNALFIAPEAPAAPEDPPTFASLPHLLASALRRARFKAPPGPLVVVGHSGAYRTIVRWLDDPALHQLILVDALYGNEPEFRAWLDRAAANRLTLVVKGTGKHADPFVRDVPYALEVPRIPKAIGELSRAERTCKLLCLRSQYGHFELITEGNTLPVLLCRTSLRAVHRPR